MRVIVVGAGIVGICSALELVRNGHEVTVLDSAPRAASLASFANAGLLSPGHCFSWAEPGIVSMMFSALLTGKDRPHIGEPWSLGLLQWLRRFARQSRRECWERNSRAALQLAMLSRDLQFGESAMPLSSYGGARDGLVYLYKEGADPAISELDLLREFGEPFELLRGEALLALEPLLVDQEVNGFDKGIYCKRDASGDARLYAIEAMRVAAGMGVQFHWETEVRSVVLDGQRVVGVETGNGRLDSDACVVASGLASSKLLRPLGYRLHIHPVSGYSVTYQSEEGIWPRRGGVSIADKVAWAPLGGGRMRFTGFADIGMPDSKLARARFFALESFARGLCPSVRGIAGDRWIGQRPMTPDGLPYLGAGAHQGLFLNCGHGAMGWTMASACAKLTADALSGRTPSIDLKPFSFERNFLN